MELPCSNESFAIEVVLIKKEIADNCVLQDGNVLEEEEAIKETDEFSALENLENMSNNMQYSSSLCEERHTEKFIKRVKKETRFNLIPEEIQIKEERLFEATDKSNIQLQNEPDNFNDELNSEDLTADENKLSSINCNYKMKSKNCTSAFSEDGKNNGLDENGDSAKPYKCDKCHRAFPRRCDFVKHNRIHTGEHPYKCAICAKTCSGARTLRIHKRTHTGEKPYECDVCNKKFCKNHHLKAHKRTHNNERPFKCLVCHKAFAQRCNLTAHMRIHTGEKPFKCQFCQYECTKRSSLKMHMRLHTGEKPFTCQHCQVSFNQSSNLKTHMRRCHSDKI